MSALAIKAALALAAHCTPMVDGVPIVPPGTLLSVAMAESHLDPQAVNVNRNGTEDRGIGQVNEVNWLRLGLTRETALDPCRNIAAAARVLAENYHGGDTPEARQHALRVTFSAYHRGPAGRYDAAYVAGVERAAAVVLPEIAISGHPALPAPAARVPDQPRPPCAPVKQDDWHLGADQAACAGDDDWHEATEAAPDAIRSDEAAPTATPQPRHQGDKNDQAARP